MSKTLLLGSFSSRGKNYYTMASTADLTVLQIKVW